LLALLGAHHILYVSRIRVNEHRILKILGKCGAKCKELSVENRDGDPEILKLFSPFFC
jgi:hypothetical protein